MGNVLGDYMVPLFFVAGSGAMLFLAYRFRSADDKVFKNFGNGLALYGLAFAIWTLAVLTKPTDLDTITTLGVIPFAAAHIFFLMVATHKMKAASRSTLVMGGIAYLVLLFLLKLFVYPSNPGFSANGLFYFHAQPPLVALYIGAFGLTLIPAIYAVGEKLKDVTLRYIVQAMFTIAAIGGIILVTSVDDNLQTINGWVMGVTYFILLTTLATKRIK